MQYSSHTPILINQLTISYGNKECIKQAFSAKIMYGDKIAIIGRNGSGKSSLIQAIVNHTDYQSQISLPEDVALAYVPQLIDDLPELSGGQRFNQKFSQALSHQPNLLLLDEPTNHLDQHNRRALFAWIKRYTGTLLVITHDLELLKFMDRLWHIHNGVVSIFNGSYANYKIQQEQEWNRLTATVKQVNLDKHRAHQQLMQEQQRAKTSRRQGEKHIRDRKYPTITSTAKARRAETTSGQNNKRIEQNKQNAINELQNLYIPEVLIPKFNLDAVVAHNKSTLTISNGSCGYTNEPILSNIDISLTATAKVAIHGDNASGKSTLIKAILGSSDINKSGEWLCPNIHDIGYLDQHYSQLDSSKTAVELISEVAQTWSHAEIREHLNSFLLRKNEEVNLASNYLSGGERVRLSLALIAARPPKLLLLDEISNNIDVETKEHLIQVLSAYPGALIMVDHDQQFIADLCLDSHYQTRSKQLLAMKEPNEISI